MTIFSVKNIYYNDVLNLKISKTYTKYNLKPLVGLTNYDEINNCGSIFINEDDYNTLFNKDLYQSSIFVKDKERIYETKEQLEYLKSIGCDMIQGYIYEKPISVASFEEKYLK